MLLCARNCCKYLTRDNLLTGKDTLLRRYIITPASKYEHAVNNVRQVLYNDSVKCFIQLKVWEKGRRDKERFQDFFKSLNNLMTRNKTVSHLTS